jgi:hypothetical protein
MKLDEMSYEYGGMHQKSLHTQAGCAGDLARVPCDLVVEIAILIAEHAVEAR